MLYHNNKYFKESKIEIVIFSILMWGCVILMGMFSFLTIYSLIHYFLGIKTLFLFLVDSIITLIFFIVLKFVFKFQLKK